MVSMVRNVAPGTRHQRVISIQLETIYIFISIVLTQAPEFQLLLWTLKGKLDSLKTTLHYDNVE